MTLPNNPFATPSGVPQPSEAPERASSLSTPAGTSSLPAPMSAPVMVAPIADPYGAAPLYAGPSNTARSSLSMRGRIAAWTIIILQGISLVNGFIPYHFDHLDDYVSQFSNPLFWLWRLIDIVVITLAVLYLRKGAVVLRYVAACIILVGFFVITPVRYLSLDVAWYYAFVPDIGSHESSLQVLRVLGLWLLEWVGVVAAILLAIPDFKPAPSPYVMSAPVPAAGAALAGHVASPLVTPEGASSEAAPEASSAQARNASGFVAPQ